MHDSKPIPTPMLSFERLSQSGAESFDDPTYYKSIAGVPQYYTLTKPGICFAVNKVSQFMHKPLISHWKAVKRIVRYLSGTTDQGLVFHSSSHFPIFAFADADWDSDVDDRRSTSGYCVYFGGNLVAWSSRKQHSVSHSSIEAEFHSVADSSTKIIWLENLLHELHIPIYGTPTIYCDNVSAVQISANPIMHSRTKYFELNLHFVQDKMNQQKLHIVHVLGLYQIADICTKPLSLNAFEKFKSKL
ncbi:uncharacterized protein LOC107627752 [Arachis ipaensis]|uniref:uncharacterized protein LOC107627752 n=1 Tax=Arachis ipaensis TaxID=130454 RepID=UPI0007AF4CF3|nr:uncharacterized protein LOC107627752 [Arachis ipaensis]